MNKFKLVNGVVAKSFLLASLAAGHVFLFCPRASKTLGGASRETVGTWNTKLKVFGHALSTVREPPFTDRGIKQGTPTTTLFIKDACTSIGQEGQCWCRGQIVKFFYKHNRVFLGGRGARVG